LANGTFITANATNNSDIYWALRGGGGGNWGIITAITFKAYKIPSGGFTQVALQWDGNYCTDSKSNLTSILDHYLSWA
jgi:FAD/FMN-containing dehydrogenase